MDRTQVELRSRGEEFKIHSKYSQKPSEGFKQGWELSFSLDFLKGDLDCCVEGK